MKGMCIVASVQWSFQHNIYNRVTQRPWNSHTPIWYIGHQNQTRILPYSLNNKDAIIYGHSWTIGKCADHKYPSRLSF